jgi:drug/metabolite transporter (DMT)-like permease
MHSQQNLPLVLMARGEHDGLMLTFLARFRVDLLLLLVAASWGSTYLVAKELVSADTVIALLALRMLFAAGIMAAIMALRRNRPTRGELVAGVPIGVLLAAVFTFETFGIAHTSATNAGLIISLTMVFTPVLESVVSRRRLPGRFFAAAAVAVAGVVLLAGNGTFESPGPGDLLVLGAAVVRAMHVVSMQKLTGGQTMDSLHLTAVQLGTCALLFTAGSLVHGESIPRYLSRLDPWRETMFLYLVLVCTVFAFFVQIWAVRRTSPSRVSLLLGTEPVWAAIIGITIAHDSVGIAGYCGIALILTGTAWGRSVEQSQRYARRESPLGLFGPKVAIPEKEIARP